MDGMGKQGERVAFLTLGCKVNAYETDAMERLFRGEGYRVVGFSEGADIYVVNTCAVTNMADHKSRQMLRRARRENPDALVVAVGCYAQASPERIRKERMADLIIGNGEKDRIVSLVRAFQRERPDRDVTGALEMTDAASAKDNAESAMAMPSVASVADAANAMEMTGAASAKKDNAESAMAMPSVTSVADATGVTDVTNAPGREPDAMNAPGGGPDRMPRREPDAKGAPGMLPEGARRERPYASLSSEAEGGARRVRAYVKIQDGCDQFCSYCVIPYVRGRVRSRSEEDVLEEIGQLAGMGCKEAVLTGIHISSYGADLLGERDLAKLAARPLLGLVEKASRIEGLERIRLSSLEPRAMTEEFAKGLSSIGKVCPHFHLSLQSGCDATLSRMNRKYTTREYEESCRIARKYFDRPAITTDVIAGFPGETEEEFLATERFLQKIAFSGVHVFPYSRREGTAAARSDGQVPQRVRQERARRLIAVGERTRREYEDALIGQEETVLVEERKEIGGRECFVGHTERYVRLAFPAAEGEDLRNQMRKVVVTGERAQGILCCERADGGRS